MQQLKQEFIKLGHDPKTVSKEEGYFYDWLLELKEAGFIHSIVIQPRYELTDAIKMKFKRAKLKTTKKKGSHFVTENISPSLMLKMHYTPDFDVYWNLNALGRFVFTEGDFITGTLDAYKRQCFFGYKTKVKVPFIKDDLPEHITLRSNLHKNQEVIHTCIEIKGTFASRQNSTAIKFPLLQKLTYNIHGIYVNKCQPLHKQKGLFAKTFTPRTFFKTEKTRKERKTAWIKMSSKDYISFLDKAIEMWDKQIEEAKENDKQKIGVPSKQGTLAFETKEKQTDSQ